MPVTSSIFIKKSTVSGTIPLLSEITASELAINLGDGGLFYSDVTESAVKLIRAGSASFAETASFALNVAGGSDGVFGGDFSGTFSGSVSGAFIAAAGTIAQPGYSFVESSSYGMTVTGSELVLSADGTGSVFVSSSRDVELPGTLILRDGINAKELVLYNTFTDNDNYLRLVIRASGNDFLILPETAGTGFDFPRVMIGAAGNQDVICVSDNFFINDLRLQRVGVGILGFVNMHFRLNAGFAIELNGGSNFIQGTVADGGTVRVVAVGVVALQAPQVNFDNQMAGTGVTASFDGGLVGQFTGTLEATGTLTGTLVGSASYADDAGTAVLAVSAVTATTASNANTASFADPPLFTAHRPVLTVVSSSVYNVLFTDYLLLIDASSGTLPTDVVLPDTVDFIKDFAGKEVTITKIDGGANDVQIMASGTQTIIGDATSSLTDQYQGLTLVPSGGIWWVK